MNFNLKQLNIILLHNHVFFNQTDFERCKWFSKHAKGMFDLLENDEMERREVNRQIP